MAINLNGPAREAAGKLARAFASDDETQIAQAFVDFQTSTLESVREEYEEAVKANDRAILAARGFRQLTNEETEYYKGVIERAINKHTIRQDASGFIHIGNCDTNPIIYTLTED
jgi:hypothetical protein